MLTNFRKLYNKISQSHFRRLVLMIIFLSTVFVGNVRKVYFGYRGEWLSEEDFILFLFKFIFILADYTLHFC